MSILSVKITAKLSGVGFAVKTASISRLGAERGRLRRPRGATAKSGARCRTGRGARSGGERRAFCGPSPIRAAAQYYRNRRDVIIVFVSCA